MVERNRTNLNIAKIVIENRQALRNPDEKV